MGNEEVNLSGEIFDAVKSTPANGLLGNEVEPDFHLVEPGSIGGGEMEMIAGSGRDPASHFGVLMRAVIVHDEMDVQMDWNTGLDLLEKLEKLLMTMTGNTACEHLA